MKPKWHSLILAALILTNGPQTGLGGNYWPMRIVNETEEVVYVIADIGNNGWEIRQLMPGESTEANRDYDWVTSVKPPKDCFGKLYFPADTPGVKVSGWGTVTVVGIDGDVMWLVPSSVTVAMAFLTAGGMNSGNDITTDGEDPALPPCKDHAKPTPTQTPTPTFLTNLPPTQTPTPHPTRTPTLRPTQRPWDK